MTDTGTSDQPGKGLPENHDLKSILEHVRGQFQYHAGQRLNTIRYFFVAYAIFVAAYVGVLSKPTAPPQASLYVQLVLGTLGLLVTLAFWGLDVRNNQMVNIDEDGLAEIEKRITAVYKFTKFEMAERWHKERGWVFTYRVIVNFMFGILTIVSAGATIWNVLQLVSCG